MIDNSISLGHVRNIGSSRLIVLVCSIGSSCLDSSRAAIDNEGF